jgi:hypothetical protein
MVSSLPATEETGALGREIEFRQGIRWPFVLLNKNAFSQVIPNSVPGLSWVVQLLKHFLHPIRAFKSINSHNLYPDFVKKNVSPEFSSSLCFPD